jgi:hypothetical protein
VTGRSSLLAEAELLVDEFQVEVLASLDVGIVDVEYFEQQIPPFSTKVKNLAPFRWRLSSGELTCISILRSSVTTKFSDMLSEIKEGRHVWVIRCRNGRRVTGNLCIARTMRDNVDRCASNLRPINEYEETEAVPAATAHSGRC